MAQQIVEARNLVVNEVELVSPEDILTQLQATIARGGLSLDRLRYLQSTEAQMREDIATGYTGGREQD